MSQINILENKQEFKAKYIGKRETRQDFLAKNLENENLEKFLLYSDIM